MKSLQIFLLTALLLATAHIAFSRNTVIVQPTDTVKTVIIKVKGVTCATDVKTIAANVEKLKGVTSCKPEKPGATTKFAVIYDPVVITEKEIYAAIEDTEGCKNPNDRPYKVKQ